MFVKTSNIYDVYKNQNLNLSICSVNKIGVCESTSNDLKSNEIRSNPMQSKTQRTLLDLVTFNYTYALKC